MQAFEFASPKTKQEAVTLLSSHWGETEILAGGTDLLSLMKDYIAVPRRVVNIKGIAELKGIREMYFAAILRARQRVWIAC